MNADELIDHIKGLIKNCNKSEYKEIESYIEILKELSKYKNMERQKTPTTITNNGESININTNGNPININTDSQNIYINNKIVDNENKNDYSNILNELEKLHKAIYARIIVGIFIICSAILFCNLITELKPQTTIAQKECNITQSNINNEESKRVKTADKKREDTSSNNSSFLVICLIAFPIFAFCIFFAYKYEYGAWIKDKELSNDLKKIYYEARINKMMKQ